MTYGCSILAVKPGYVDTGGGEDHDDGIRLDACRSRRLLRRCRRSEPETGERVELRSVSGGLRGCEKPVASEGRSRSAGAQEPECMLK